MARILVIDDDPDTRAMLEQTLTPAGYDVILAIAQNVAAVGILPKPFVADELIAAVARALGEQSPAR